MGLMYGCMGLPAMSMDMENRNAYPTQLRHISLTKQFLINTLQEVVYFNRLVRPEIAYLLKADHTHRVPGNAFSAGTVSFLGDAQLNSALDFAKDQYNKNPLEENNQKLVAFILGSIVVDRMQKSLEATSSLDYLTEPVKGTELDAMVLQHYFLRAPFPENVDEHALGQLLRTFVSRAFIQYHTLKCSETDPLAWIEYNLAWREKMAAQCKVWAAKLMHKDKTAVPSSVFNPKDKMLLALSNYHHYKIVDSTLIKETLNLADKDTSAIGVAFGTGLNTIMQLDMNW